MGTERMQLSGWGRYPRADCRTIRIRGAAELAGLGGPAIARGAGRSYGDSALNPALTLDMRGMDRMLDFDPETGVLVAEAGVMLSDVIATFLPRGWFPAVTPGTRFVTLGGMIAADVHGKNHRSAGSIRRHLDWAEVAGPDGTVRRLAPGSEDFDWTLGGMGLTGVILRAALRLRRVESGWIRQTSTPAPDLATAMDALEQAETEYAVAWIDCLATNAALGRSLVLLGDHATRAELPPDRAARPFETPRRRRASVPLTPPSGLLNGWTVRAFNELYWRNGLRRAGESLVDWDSYFYPLDTVLGWNRIYGRRGFVQYQCVLPPDRAADGLTALLREISAARQGSFLAVLKRLGPGAGGLSFPMEGFTLALDFPVNARVLALLDRLDRITLEHGGRYYLAKDARLTAATLHDSDPRAGAFRARRQDTGAAPRFASLQSERLDL